MNSPILATCGMLAVALLCPPRASLAQIAPYGLTGLSISALAAEQSDPDGTWDPGLAIRLFAASGDAVFETRTGDTAQPHSWMRIFSPSGIAVRVSALTAQHWGAGPRDGLFLFAALRPAVGSGSVVPRLLRFDVEGSSFPGISGIAPADSGIPRMDTLTTISGLAAYYYTGHTPPQPLIAGMLSGAYTGSAGGYFWQRSVFDRPIDARINAVDVTPKWFGRAAWAAGRTGVMPAAFRSTDQGATWTTFNLPAMIEGEAGPVAVRPGSPDTAFAALRGTVFRTVNGGKDWTAVLISIHDVFTALACDPLAPNTVFAGAGPEFRCWRSTDLGTSWTPVQQPRDSLLAGVTCMTVALLDSIPMGREPRRGLFIGTDGSGVWVFDTDSTPLTAEHPSGAADLDAVLWPNPARGDASITVTAAGPASIRAALSDVLGRQVWMTSTVLPPSGSITMGIPAARLVPGVYICRVSSGIGLRLLPLRIVR